MSSGCIEHVIPGCVPSMKNRTRISLFVTELYHGNRISLCVCFYSPALVFGCHRYIIQLTSLHLKMLLSCTVTRGIWRSQLLICDDTEYTACSARTSPYRQGLNSYIVHCHSLFQAFRTLTKLDIIYSLLKFFINTSRYTASTTYAHDAGAPDHLKLSQRPHEK